MGCRDLEQLRRLAAAYGLPLGILDRLTLRPREVARTTGLSLRKVEQLVETGRLPAVKVDRVVLTIRTDIQFTDDDSNVTDPFGQNVFSYDRAIYGLSFSLTFN